MIRIGLTGYFHQNPSSVQDRFPLPESYPSDDSSNNSDDDPAVLDSDNNLLFFPPLPTNPYVRLRLAQDAIGWDHFLRGKISKEWEILQFKYATRHSLLKESQNWITWLIKNMAHQSFAIWDSRNKSRHGHDYSTSIQAETAQVHRDISVLYELRDSVLPEDRDLFCKSIDAHLLCPLSVLKGWLAINRKFILWSVKIANIQAKTGTRPISQYFTARARRPHIPRQKKTPSTTLNPPTTSVCFHSAYSLLSPTAPSYHFTIPQPSSDTPRPPTTTRTSTAANLRLLPRPPRLNFHLVVIWTRHAQILPSQKFKLLINGRN
jgi:hypothetical protein